MYEQIFGIMAVAVVLGYAGYVLNLQRKHDAKVVSADTKKPPNPPSFLEKTIQDLNETLKRLERKISGDPPPPPPEDSAYAEPKKPNHPYVTTLDGKEPEIPVSFFHTKKFLYLGFGGAFLIGLIFYIVTVFR